MGKLIVIEGLDGSGKSTQLDLLLANLQKQGVDCRRFSFPDYESDSSALIKMYLHGAFGTRPDDVNPYAAAAFFSVDRYASYKQNWETYYKNGGNVIVGRYTTSNAIHQTSKLPPAEWKAYLNWLYDFEYRLMGIPQPDLVLMLDMPTEVAQKLLTGRYQGDESKKDIHERDVAYLEKCREAAVYTARSSGWEIIPCADGSKPRSVEDIADTLLKKVLSVVNH